MKKIMLTALAALSPMAQAECVLNKMSSHLESLLESNGIVTNQTFLSALRLDNEYTSYKTERYPDFYVETDIILSAPVIKGLMTFFMAKENSTKTSLIHAGHSFLKAVLAILLLKSAKHLDGPNFDRSYRTEMAQTITVAVLRALAAFSYICGQTDTGFGDVYRALKEKGVRSLLGDENLSLAAMLRQSANVILPLLCHSNIKDFVQLQLTPKSVLDSEDRLHYERAPFLSGFECALENKKQSLLHQQERTPHSSSSRMSLEVVDSADQDVITKIVGILNDQHGYQHYTREDIENPNKMSIDKLIHATERLSVTHSKSDI